MPVDPTSEQLAREISEARRELIARTQATPGQWRAAWELKAEVRNGWSAGTTSLALSGLIADGTFDVQGDSVRLNV